MSEGKLGGVANQNLCKRFRQANLDIIRIIALMFVFMIHGVETVWGVSPDGLAGASELTKIEVMIIYTLGRLSVPLFLFITGYLMLGKYYKKEDIFTFYKTKVWKLLKITWIWTAIYCIAGILFLNRDFSVIDVIKQFLFISDQLSAPHMWYMPAIIGVYLFIPFVSNILQKIDTRVLIVLLCLAVFYLFVVPTANDFSLAYNRSPIINKVELHYLGGFCGAMVVIGQLIRRGMVWLNKHVKSWWLVLITIISAYLSVAMHYLLVSVLGQDYGPWYDSIFILFASTCLFILLLRLFEKSSQSQLLSMLATSVFGCYLVHYVFIYMLNHLVHDLGVGAWLQYAAVVVGPVIASVVVVLIVRKASPSLAKSIGFIM